MMRRRYVLRLPHLITSLSLMIQYKWWEDQDNDGSVKWNTLEHWGVLFPPPYIPLPKGVKMRYEGEL